MCSLLRYDRRLWLPLTMLGVIACRVPGEDWVAATEGPTTSAAGNTVASTVTSGGPATANNTTNATSGGDDSTDTSGSSGGSTSATSDGGGATSDANTDTTGDATTETSGDASGGATSTTTASGTGGVDPDSLIDNGDFSAGEEGWEIDGDASVDVSSGEYCMTLNNSGTVYLDWPTEFDPARVANGVSYVFSYVVYYSGEAPTVSVKIGQPVEPYNAFAEGDIDVSTSPQTFMHTFTVDSDDQAGLRFTVDGPSGTEVCFDNVALVAQ